MTELDLITQEFRDNFKTDYDNVHNLRYGVSYLKIRDYIKPDSHILDMGGINGELGAFGWYINMKHGVKAKTSDTDLRYPLSHIPDNTYDIVLNMEVFEHIKDQENAPIHCFDFSGVNTFISECYRVLKPGGVMLLTTPNAHSLTNFIRILDCNTPVFYKPHVREYGARETANILSEHGFKIKLLETHNVWNELQEEKRNWIRSVAINCGSNANLMENDTFILAEK
jgi:predicted SAM-dependent methyltransferase